MPFSERSAAGSSPPPRVVIVGAGFAGLSAARALAGVGVAITLIDRRNFHLFQPLLYQVATAGLTPSDIAWPIRSILRDQRNVRVVLGTVTGVDRDRRRVTVSDGECFEYDWLILATGATHNYFGNEHWASFAPGLKRVDDATTIRRRILLAFERAELSDDPDQRRRLMSFVIVGGGPTGVELAGAIAELARKALARDFRRIDPRQTRITLLQGGSRLLPGFPEKLSRHAAQALESLGVEVRTDARVTACDGEGVWLGDEQVLANTVLWAAGVSASPAADWAGAPSDGAGRACVGPDLSVPGEPRIFVVGDTAAMSGSDGEPVPGIAPAAKQAGRYAASIIAADVAGRSRPGPFRYRHMGSLATIGRHQAVIDFGRITLSGWPAWWVWGLAHVYFLIGMRNRLLVAMQWFFSYITFGRGARLIAGTEADPPSQAKPNSSASGPEREPPPR
jgi:NADH dehydrogenase